MYKGTAAVILNEATVRAALQDWFDKHHLNSSSPDIVSISAKDSYENGGKVVQSYHIEVMERPAKPLTERMIRFGSNEK